MTRIKLCGLTRLHDILIVNELKPEYIGFVFAAKSRRCISTAEAAALKEKLNPDITAVGVFVDEDPETVKTLLHKGIIDMVQLHGNEDEEYIRDIQAAADRPVIKAFRMESLQDVKRAAESSADFVLLDSGAGGSGTVFDWNLLRTVRRPYFLAGGLNADNVNAAVKKLNPYGVDVSSGIETDGFKDEYKIRKFIKAVRGE